MGRIGRDMSVVNRMFVTRENNEIKTSQMTWGLFTVHAVQRFRSIKVNCAADKTIDSYSYVGTYPGIIGTKGTGPGNAIGIEPPRCLNNKNVSVPTFAGVLLINIRRRKPNEESVLFVSVFISHRVAYIGFGE